MNTNKQILSARCRCFFTAFLSLLMLFSACAGTFPLLSDDTGCAAVSVGKVTAAGNERHETTLGMQSVTPSEYNDDDPNAFYGSDGTIKPANRKYEHTPITKIRVSNLSPQVSTDLDYVEVWYSPFDDSRYLFLPATADRKRLTIEWLAGGQTLSLNGIPVVSGKTTDLLASADTFSVTAGSTDCGTLHILQSTLNVVYLATGHGGTDYLDQQHWGGTETAKTLMLTETGQVSYSGNIEKLWRHGNSSWDYSKKKSYNFKLPVKANLYGLGKAKKWIFLSNYLDYSMLRNVITTEMGRQAGIEYTMDCTFVDLYADGSYRGTYQLSEKVQVQKQRVNITDLEEKTEALNSQELSKYTQGGTKDYALGSYKYWNIPKNPSNITGGYLLQFQLCNRYGGKAESGFVTSRGQTVQIDAPEYASKAQVEYIRGFVQDMEDAIYASNGINAKGKHYSDYIDVDSLILGYMLQEISQNIDATTTSFFLYKDSDAVGDGKLHYGPAWDFDLAYNNFSLGVTAGVAGDPSQQVIHYSGDVNSLFAAYYPINGFDAKNPDCATSGVGWIMQLYTNDPSFARRVGELYYERFDNQLRELSDTSQENGAKITRLGKQLSASAAMNNARWHMYGGRPYKIMGPFHGDTYEEIVEYLRDRVSKRRAFLQKEWLFAKKELQTQALSTLPELSERSRYDEEGQQALDAAITEGTAAISDAASYDAVMNAYEQTAAKLQEIPRAELSGDFDDNLQVEVRDAQLLLMYYTRTMAKLPASADSTQRRNGDVDKNGTLNAVDALHILRHCTAKLANTSYPLPVAAPEDTP